MRLSEICPKTADSRAERDMPCSSQRFAGMCWSRPKLDEDNNYQWWILVLWVLPGNISPVIIIEDWVSEAEICMPSSERGESDVNRFLWSQRHHSPWVCTRWSNCQQGVLCRSSLLAAWCGVVQATCIMEARWLTAAPWQWPHPLVPPCTELLAKHQIPQVLHPPYPLDMAPCDCFLFLEVKMLL